MGANKTVGWEEEPKKNSLETTLNNGFKRELKAHGHDHNRLTVELVGLVRLRSAAERKTSE